MYSFLCSLFNLSTTNFYFKCFYLQYIKTESEICSYIKLKDFFFDAGYREDEKWFKPLTGVLLNKQWEATKLVFDSSIQDLYLTTKPPLYPFILFPLFKISNFGEDFLFIRYFTEGDMSSYIEKIYDSSLGYTIYHFKSVISNGAGVVKSIKIDEEEVYLNSTADHPDKSSYIVFEKEDECFLYVGAFIHNLCDNGGKKLDSFLQEYLYNKTTATLAKEASFEISIDISGLIKGLSIFGRLENDIKHRESTLILKDLNYERDNLILTVRLTTEVRKNEMGFRIEKFLQNRKIDTRMVLIACDQPQFEMSTVFTDVDLFIRIIDLC
ncbi:hypothetical protein CDIK_1093 [Cucumispora dikerogammari]|nr:hypothetical protein CDIK_1093 [Cucumispora dikerogammari]